MMEKAHHGSESSDTESKTVDIPNVVEAENVTHTLPFDIARTNSLLRKLDWHLVPFLSLLYL